MPGTNTKKLTLMNQRKKWKTGQRLVMNNNIRDIRRHGGRFSPTSTSNKRMEAITTVVLEKGPPRARETPPPRPPGHPARYDQLGNQRSKPPRGSPTAQGMQEGPPGSNKGEPRTQGQRSPGQLMPMNTPQRNPKKSRCIIFKFINIQILTCINNIKL